MAKPLTNDFAEQRSLVNMAKPIFLYRNLHKDCFSVKQGTVKFHTQDIWMTGCYFPVNERLRLKVIERKQKNVHAYVKGYLTDFSNAPKKGRTYLNEVTYNPYLYKTFMFEKAPILWSSVVHARIGNGIPKVFANIEIERELLNSPLD